VELLTLFSLSACQGVAVPEPPVDVGAVMAKPALPSVFAMSEQFPADLFAVLPNGPQELRLASSRWRWWIAPQEGIIGHTTHCNAKGVVADSTVSDSVQSSKVVPLARKRASYAI